LKFCPAEKASSYIGASLAPRGKGSQGRKTL
jgi:hypothetical protein